MSQQLAVLERETGVALLERAGRGVRLTDAGLVLAAHAAALLDRAEQAETDLAAAFEGIDDDTLLSDATEQVNAAAFAVQVAWLRLFADAGCLDELDLTIAPGLVGGASGRMVAGAAESLRSFQLVHVLVDDDGGREIRTRRPGRGAGADDDVDTRRGRCPLLGVHGHADAGPTQPRPVEAGPVG